MNGDDMAPLEQQIGPPLTATPPKPPQRQHRKKPTWTTTTKPLQRLSLPSQRQQQIYNHRNDGGDNYSPFQANDGDNTVTTLFLDLEIANCPFLK